MPRNFFLMCIFLVMNPKMFGEVGGHLIFTKQTRPYKAVMLNFDVQGVHLRAGCVRSPDGPGSRQTLEPQHQDHPGEEGQGTQHTVAKDSQGVEQLLGWIKRRV
jgi:hypothetical protein